MLLKKYFLYILFKGKFCCHMDVALYQFHGFSIGFCFPLCWEAMWSVKLENIASGASVMAVENKIDQAMDFIKNNLLYEVREEVEILSEQIKDLAKKGSGEKEPLARTKPHSHCGPPGYVVGTLGLFGSLLLLACANQHIATLRHHE
uniref:TSC22 domain family protein 1 n=1 Tax=Erpetoichthys calabaricus TaxID=27687 RepID=A0A8C4SYT8_ERPCA